MHSRVFPFPQEFTALPLCGGTLYVVPRVLDIGVDLDGCAYDFFIAFRNYVANLMGVDPLTFPEPSTWRFYEGAPWNMVTQEFIDHVNAAANAGIMFASGDPLDGVADGFARLRAAGHRIHVVTDRGRTGAEGVGERLTREWLTRHALEFDSLTLTPDKTSVHTDVFIDDRPENFVVLRAAGVDAFLRDQPYNQFVDTPPNRRVRSFTEFTDRVLALA